MAALVVTAGLLGACSGSDASSDGTDGMDDSKSTDTADTSADKDSSDQEDTVSTKTGPPSSDDVATPAVEGPITTGAGEVVLSAPKSGLAEAGYVQEEFFISGEATSYTSEEPLTEDGEWTAIEDSTAPYTTRIVVRRPADSAAFKGTVVVEWLNVSGGLDADPDWTFTHEQIIRSGSAWVGVSAQKDGIVGGGNSLGAALALKNADPVRYGPLDHPGDDYSYDIYSQAGAAVWNEAATVLGGVEPKYVIAMGESQSAFRLTTYVNAIAPLTKVYGGYLVHSRGADGAPLSEDSATPVMAPDPTFSRTDLGVPVFVFSSETDLVGGLGYVRARQPNSSHFVSWEVAGTSHVDAYGLGIGDQDDGSGEADTVLFDAMSNPPSSVYFGIIECDSPINAGPHTYVVRAALAALEAWVIDGTTPPEMPPLKLDPATEVYTRDLVGNALGGVRTPQVDAPIATLSGLGQDGESFCGLFGTTVPFTPEQLAEAYPTHDAFVTAWNASLDASVAAGAILEVDAERLRTVAQDSTIGG